jgi:hypothetical protein
LLAASIAFDSRGRIDVGLGAKVNLEAINTQLEVRIRSLEGRILELEARDAARTAVQHADD